MKCRSCGYLSFEDRPLCPRCGEAPDAAPTVARETKPARRRGAARRRSGARAAPGAPARRDEPLRGPEQLELRVTAPQGEREAGPGQPCGPLDDLIPPTLPAPEPWPPPGEGGVAGGPAREVREAIIDRDDAVPEEFWAAEGAGLARRAAAAAADALVLAGALGLFAAAAGGVLSLGGVDVEALLRRDVAAAVLPYFAALALLLSLAYSVSFHAQVGSTPGKLLAGLQLRTLEGGGLSAARCLLRWGAAVISLAALGAGVAWALFEPRRRGWADLASGTVVAERRPRVGGGAAA